MARRPGIGERLVRWTWRNPLVAALFAAVVMILMGSLAGLSGLYLNAERQRNLAERQRQVAEQREAEARTITKFYEEHILAAARPKGWGAGLNVTLKEALDQAAPRIGKAFVGRPELEAAIRDSLGVTYWHLGDFEAANTHLEKAYVLRRQVLGSDHLDTLTSLQHLARQRWRQGKLREAELLARRGPGGACACMLGAEHVDTLWSQINLGVFLAEQSQLDEAETQSAPGDRLLQTHTRPRPSPSTVGSDRPGAGVRATGQTGRGSPVVPPDA